MKVLTTPKADADLEKMETALRDYFISHFEKIETMPPRRHLRFGLSFCVENVTSQARFVYKIEGETIWVYRCFETHKEYEKWYHTFR